MGGSRGSTVLWSRSACGSRKSLNLTAIQFPASPTSTPTPRTASYHSHLIDPATGFAFLASRPQASTCPRSSYSRHVGTFLKVSIDPGQCRICCTFPAAMRDDPYACVTHTRFDFPPEDADATYHTRESSPWTANVSSQCGCGNDAHVRSATLTKVDGDRHFPFVREWHRERNGNGRGRLICGEEVRISRSGIRGARSSQRAQRTHGIDECATAERAHCGWWRRRRDGAMGGRRRGREARQGMHRWRGVNAWRMEWLLLQKGSDRWARRRLVRGHGKGLESASNGGTPALDLAFRSRSSTTRHLETDVFSLRALRS
jgi:hypothetical protein